MLDGLMIELARHNMTCKELAKKLNKNPATIALKIAGISPFKSDELWEIADYFNCTIDYLVGRENLNKTG